MRKIVLVGLGFRNLQEKFKTFGFYGKFDFTMTLHTLSTFRGLSPLRVLPPPLAQLEFEPGDEPQSAVGDFESASSLLGSGGDEVLEVVEVSEAIEKWAAAAAAAAGNKNGGIFGGTTGPPSPLARLFKPMEI